MQDLTETGPSGGAARAIMRWTLAAFYTAAGVAHIFVPDKLLSITPSWVPFAPQVIFLTGLFEFASTAGHYLVGTVLCGSDRLAMELATPAALIAAHHPNK